MSLGRLGTLGTTVGMLGVRDKPGGLSATGSGVAPSSITISRVQDWTNTKAVGAGLVQLAFASNPTSGNLVVVVSNIANASRTLTPTDDFGDGIAWNTAKSQAFANIGGASYIFWKKVGTCTNKTVTVTADSGTVTQGISIAEFAPSSPATFAVDGTPVASTGSTGAPSPGAITTTTASGLVVGHCNTDASPSAVAGFAIKTNDSSYNGWVVTEDQITSAAGSYTAGFSSANATWLAIAAAFKAT